MALQSTISSAPSEKPYEDGASDSEESYSEDLDDFDGDETLVENMNSQLTAHQTSEDTSSRLLTFIDRINVDIQKYFGKKFGDDDNCDIYEDKWAVAKSGRELYYTDLLRIAQGEGENTSPGKLKVTIPYSGKMNRQMGIGPLKELFEHGLKNFILNEKLKSKKVKRLKSTNNNVLKHSSSVPWQKRDLPPSFWKEPSPKKDRHGKNNNEILSSSKPLDFSDLLQSWSDGGEDAEPVAIETRPKHVNDAAPKVDLHGIGAAQNLDSHQIFPVQPLK